MTTTRRRYRVFNTCTAHDHRTPTRPPARREIVNPGALGAVGIAPTCQFPPCSFST